MAFTIRFRHPETGELASRQVEHLGPTLKGPFLRRLTCLESGLKIHDTEPMYLTAIYRLHKAYDGIYDYWREG